MIAATHPARKASTPPLPPLGFGGGSLFGVRGEADATRLAGYAFDRGFRYFDTAPLYGRGLGEHALGTALRRIPRDEVIVSTKVGRRLRPRCASPTPDDGLPFGTFYDYSYDGALRSLDDSLQRLGVCRVDVALIHDVNPRWHGDDYGNRFAEAMDGAYRALERLRGEGVVRAIGVGVKGADVCLRFARAGDFDCFMLAGGYTLLEHAALDDFLPHCEANGIAVIVASPFNSGILATGVVEGARYFYQPAPDDVKARVRRLDDVCRRHDVPLGAVALQFTLAHPAVHTAVCGYRTTDEVDTNRSWAVLPIPDALWDELRDADLIPVDAPTPRPKVPS